MHYSNQRADTIGGMKWLWIPGICLWALGGALCVIASATQNEWPFMGGFLLAIAGSGWMHWLRRREQPPVTPTEVEQSKPWRPWWELALFSGLLCLGIVWALDRSSMVGYVMVVMASLGVIVCVWQFVAVWMHRH
jgi:hypothetical protein